MEKKPALGIITTDKKGKILDYRSISQGIFGWKDNDIVGKNLASLLPVKQRGGANVSSFLESRQNSFMSVEFTSKSKKDIPLWIGVRKNSEGADLTYSITIVDLSDLDISSAIENSANNRALKIFAENIPGTAFRCIYSRQREITYLSQSIKDLSGRNPDDFMNGKYTYRDLMSPEDEERIWQSIGKSLLSGETYTVEYRMLNASGGSKWVSENGRLFFDDEGIPQWIVGIIADNTEPKTRNIEFESTVKALNKAMAVIEFDMRGCILNANEYFLNLTGYKLDEIKGHHHRIFCTREQSESPEYKQFWENMRNGNYDSGEYRRIGKGGKEIWIQAMYNPIFDTEGKPYKIVKFAMDLSRRRDMEQELRSAKEMAESAAEARGTFMANMSHEIRTPMNSIIGFTDVLLKTKLDERQKHYLKIVRNASHSLLRLLNEILDMSKLEKGAVTLEIRDFDLDDLCEHILASFKINAAKKGIDLIFDKDSSVPRFLKGDSLRIQQILLNLISNAIKFTEKGSVTLKVRYKKGQLVMNIIDTGLGIDKAYLERLFDPFTQAEASTTRRFGGTGLGTTISYQLTTLMGGTIEVDSSPDKGSNFTIILPLPKGQAGEEESIYQTDIPRLKILTVDDTKSNLELVKITMASSGNHDIHFAGGGEEAVEKRKQEDFDLILMDMQMPGVDGLEATRRIRAYEESSGIPKMPIIAFSASVLERDRQDALEAGMDGFAYKPINPPALYSEISRVLGLEKEEESSQYLPEDSGSLVEQPGENSAEFLSDHESVINWDEALKLWKDKKILINSIRQLLNENKDTTKKLQEAFSNNKLTEVAKEAHRLVGASGNLKLANLYHLAVELEKAAREEDASVIPDLIEKVSTDLSLVEQAVEKAEAEIISSSETPEAEPLNKEGITECLKRMEALVKKNEMPLPDMKLLQASLPPEKIKPLGESLESFDFKKALKEIRKLKSGEK